MCFLFTCYSCWFLNNFPEVCFVLTALYWNTKRIIVQAIILVYSGLLLIYKILCIHYLRNFTKEKVGYQGHPRAIITEVSFRWSGWPSWLTLPASLQSQYNMTVNEFRQTCREVYIGCSVGWKYWINYRLLKYDLILECVCMCIYFWIDLSWIVSLAALILASFFLCQLVPCICH